MKLTEIDPNLATKGIENIDFCWLDAEQKPFQIYGLLPKTEDCFQRIPTAVAETVSPNVASFNHAPTGGRVRFQTDSASVAIRATMPENGLLPHFTKLGQSGFDLYRCDGGDYEHIGSFLPDGNNGSYQSSVRTDGKLHTYMIHFPLFSRVQKLMIGLHPNAEILEPEPYRYNKPILFYGSSITAGACTSRPGNSYPAMISQLLNCDFVNLGWSGSARAERAMAEYLATLDPLVFVYDYDHNAPDPDYLRETHERLYRIFREAHPDTPIVMVSAPTDPEPEYPENRQKRKNIILQTYRNGLANCDAHLYFVDGEHLLDGELQCACTIEKTHPNDLGYYRMAIGIGKAVRQAIAEREGN